MGGFVVVSTKARIHRVEYVQELIFYKKNLCQSFFFCFQMLQFPPELYVELIPRLVQDGVLAFERSQAESTGKRRLGNERPQVN